MPVRDRTTELQQTHELLGNEKSKHGAKKKNKKEDKGAEEDFMLEANKIETEIKKMKNDVSELKKLHKNLFSTPFPDESQSKALEEQIRQNATKMCASIKQLEDNYKQDIFVESTFKRIRSLKINTLVTELNESTNEFFKIQAEYTDKMKTRLRKQIGAKGISMDESQLNKLLEQNSYCVFTENYISNVQEAEQTLRDLQDRKKDILALESSLAEVNLLFKEMNLLVSTQGETLVRIEDATNQAADLVQGGNHQLMEARIKQAQARKRKICILGIVITVVIIIVVIIVITLVI